MGRCMRPKMLAHVGQQLQHLVLADATLRDLSALSGHKDSFILTGLQYSAEVITLRCRSILPPSLRV